MAPTAPDQRRGAAAPQPSSTSPPPVLALRGELDLAAAPLIIETGLQELKTGDGSLVIDLAEVTFVDSSALGAFVALRNEAAGLGGTVTIRSLAPHVRRVFEITALIPAFGIEPD
jgi:anti-sigma B factor antagonist